MKLFILSVILVVITVVNAGSRCPGFAYKTVNYCLEQHEVCLNTLKKSRCDCTGYDFDGVSKVCYKLHTKCVNWERANDICCKNGGRLLVLDNRKKFDRFREILETFNKNVHAVQVGYRYSDDHGEFRWVNGKRVKNFMWGLNQPNTKPGVEKGEKCGAIGLNWGGEPRMLHDSCCKTKKLPFICEKLC